MNKTKLFPCYFIKHFNTIAEASKFMNCSNSSIYRAAKGERKTCLNYIWKF